MFPYQRPANLDRPPLAVIDGGRDHHPKGGRT